MSAAHDDRAALAEVLQRVPGGACYCGRGQRRNDRALADALLASDWLAARDARVADRVLGEVERRITGGREMTSLCSCDRCSAARVVAAYRAEIGGER